MASCHPGRSALEGKEGAWLCRRAEGQQGCQTDGKSLTTWPCRSVANIPDIGKLAKAIILHDEAEMDVMRSEGVQDEVWR
jgi:hypothetical protein